MKIRNQIATFVLAASLMLPGMPALAARSASVSVNDCAKPGTAATAKLDVSGGEPARYEFRLYCDGKRVASTSAKGSADSITIPGKYLSKAGEYTLCAKVIGKDGSYKIVEDCFTVNGTTANTCDPTVKPAATAKPTTKPTTNPTAKPTAAPTNNPGGTSSASLANEVVRQVNQDRAKYGLGALTVDADLTSAACVRAAEIVKSFSHTRPDGSSWTTVSGKARGENLAKGQQTVDKVMAGWMSSEGHRANILRSSFKTIGVCAYQYNGVMYWVQIFG